MWWPQMRYRTSAGELPLPNDYYHIDLHCEIANHSTVYVDFFKAHFDINLVFVIIIQSIYFLLAFIGLLGNWIFDLASISCKIHTIDQRSTFIKQICCWWLWFKGNHFQCDQAIKKWFFYNQKMSAKNLIKFGITYFFWIYWVLVVWSHCHLKLLVAQRTFS